MIKLTLFMVGLLCLSALQAQERIAISGSISDLLTGETLAGAVVYLQSDHSTGVSANAYGFYSILLSAGESDLVFRHMGYESQTVHITETTDITLNIQLKPTTTTLNTAEISSELENENITTHQMGAEKLQIKEVRKIPVLLGEQDILKTLTLLPGVKTTGEGSGGFFVRGGNSSQNLILLDEAVVYNPNHLLGFFSTFNSDAIKDVTLWKGTAPAAYGGRISSVLEVRMKEGDLNDYHVGGGIGLISSRLNVQGPIVKERGSFILTGRRSYADLFLKLSSNDALANNQLYFYDLNAKANYKIGKKDRLFISGYFGRDVIRFADRFGIDWGNTTGTLRWNHIWSDKLFSNTSLIFSDYDYRVEINRDVDDFSLTSIIRNWSLKHDFQLFLNNKNSLDFGFQTIKHTITPGQVEVSEGSDIVPTELQNRYAWESSVYVANTWKPNKQWNINLGLRGTHFGLTGPGDFYSYENGNPIDSVHYATGELAASYFNIEPRLSIAWLLSESQSIKFSLTRNTQHLHLIQNSNSSTPTDIWIASSNNVKPEIGDQLSLGYFQNFQNNKYQFSIEAYYRHMDNQLDLKNGAEIRANEHIEGELLYGIGRAYGLELLLKRTKGNFTGWVSYTLSRTERQIEGINQGNWYPARQDATHDVSIVAIYSLNDKWDISATWVFNTGNAVTFPSGKYEINGEIEFYYTERNGYRMPDYHRLDLGLTRSFRKNDRYESSLNFSLYNAYGRKNAYTIDFEEDPDDPTKTTAVMTYLFTFVPSITYNFNF
ncbi:MAG: TonB-dependent receptor [Flavobacteriales bacterium]|nr:TonB-dependent receptor [Flavobacteriales bacterium]